MRRASRADAPSSRALDFVPMRVSYHPDYRVDLPSTHPYPMGKYPLLHDMLRARGIVAAEDIMTPEEASLPLLGAVHGADYLERLASGTLAPADVRRLGVPMSARLWRRSRLAVHGTLLAAEAALVDGLSANVAGGTHHAFADHGEGFCVLNDVAVAIHALRRHARIERALVVDLDVHQGNGTATIFAGDPAVYTLSLHGERNYPSRKANSTHDVGLPDGTGDDDYLAALGSALARALETADAGIVFYVAGVDVVAGDHYGRFALSESGLRRRERVVIDAVRSKGLPLVIVLGGGYAPTTLRTAELHAIVFEEAIRRWRLERETP
jgi:acetoin utilization deacetylase AcuC-like enzyme